MLTLYIGALAPFIFLMIDVTVWMERHPVYLSEMVVAVLGLHVLVEWYRDRSRSEEDDFEEIDDLFQTLGLS
jgi:hypothetical protein